MTYLLNPVIILKVKKVSSVFKEKCLRQMFIKDLFTQLQISWKENNLIKKAIWKVVGEF